MGCDSNIKQNCGEIVYSQCVRYEGGFSTNSSLDSEDCVSIEEVAEDIYAQLDTIVATIGQEGEGNIGTVTSVNNINPNGEGLVTLDSDDIPQGTTNLYATTSEKAVWNGKQNALGFTPVPDTRTVNGLPLTTNITLDKTSIGLGNVPNINTTIASNITQTSSFRFVTDAEKATWNASTISEVTYAQLLNLKNTATLVKGKTYLLTDYVTTYLQPVTETIKSSGIVEPLYITATNINTLSNVCKSKLYPEDTVYYEITGDIGNGAGTEGFTKGKIYRRVDTLRNNDIGTDWRHVKYDRSGTDKLLFENYTGCEDNNITTNVLMDSVAGSGFSNNNFTSFTGNTTVNNFKNNSGEVNDKDLTGVAELHNKMYSHLISSRTDGEYQFTYIDNFGDIITEDLV